MKKNAYIANITSDAYVCEANEPAKKEKRKTSAKSAFMVDVALLWFGYGYACIFNICSLSSNENSI